MTTTRDHTGAVTWIRLKLFLALLGAGLAGTAQAGSFAFGEINANYKLTLNYGLAMRMQDPSEDLINGPVDPFELHLDQATQGSGFTHTGLPKTINQDDGDRNFKKGRLINNRMSAFIETQFTYKNYGLVLNADGFYDRAYHKRNDNDSPDTVNKDLPEYEFTETASYYDGERTRILDAYIYGNWTLGEDKLLDVRVGNHLVAWGESLFFPNIAGAQSRADATKAFVPGAEVKEILLPTNQISANLAVGNRWNFMSYYKLDFKATEIFPVGDYFSPTDSIGPGAEFSYGAGNPLFLDGCPGLLGPLSNLCILGGIGGAAFGAPRNILIPYRGVIKTSKKGQYGAGVKYQLTPQTNVSLYALRYTDPNPSVVQHSGFPVIATFPTTITTSVFNEPTPDYYQVKYFEDIKMYAGSFSTVLGPLSVAGEVSYKDGASVAVQAVELGTLNPVFTRGNVVQAQTSAIYAANPHLWYDDVALVGEVAYVHAIDAEPFPSQPGIVVVGNGDTLFYDKNAWGFELLGIPTKRNVIGGWDLTTPVTFAWLVKGNPAIPGSLGALYGEGDMRLSLGASMQYLQNFQVSLGYNFFFGDTEKNIGESFLKQNPYTDRDYLTLNFKYSL